MSWYPFSWQEGHDVGSEHVEFLYRPYRLDCGHSVSASEDSGGMDELPRVTEADVQRLLDFKIATHDCARYEKAEAVRLEGRPFG